MRIRQPKDFWAMFKKKGGKIEVPPAELQNHYQTLLYDPAAPSRIEKVGTIEKLGEEEEWKGGDVEAAVNRMKNNKARGTSFICN